MTPTQTLKHFDDWVHHRFDASHTAVRNGAPNRRRIVIRRTQSLGDCLAATCVAKALVEQGFSVEWQADARMHPVLRRVVKNNGRSGEKLISVLTDIPKQKRGVPDSHQEGAPDVNLDGAYESDLRRGERHFAEMFTEAANRQLGKLKIQLPYPPKNFAPKMESDPQVRKQALENIEKLERGIWGTTHALPRPWVMICPKSWSFANRTVPDEIWGEACRLIGGTKFWLSNNTPPKVKGLYDLNARHVDLLIEYLSLADLLVTVDSGPLHIAAAMGIPCVAIKQQSDPALHLSAQKDFVVVEPEGLDCLGCNLERCPLHESKPPCQNISSQIIADAVNARLRSVTSDDVSAIVCVFKPKPENLRRCLECVLPQVSELIVCGDLDTPWPPPGLVNNPKIKLVRLERRNSGYGAKVNRAMRESNGRFCWQTNDDLFPGLDVCEILMAHMADPEVGAVTYTLRYPSGELQFSGLGRPPGHVGFGHLDHRKMQGRFTEPVAQESLCGASVLIRRKAFYDAGGMDENFHLYSEDSALGLQIRQAGYRIIFDPRATGIHIEHESTGLSGDLSPLLEQSHEIFNRKWSGYFNANPDPSKLGTFEK